MLEMEFLIYFIMFVNCIFMVLAWFKNFYTIYMSEKRFTSKDLINNYWQKNNRKEENRVKKLITWLFFGLFIQLYIFFCNDFVLFVRNFL